MFQKNVVQRVKFIHTRHSVIGYISVTKNFTKNFDSFLLLIYSIYFLLYCIMDTCKLMVRNVKVHLVLHEPKAFTNDRFISPINELNLYRHSKHFTVRNHSPIHALIHTTVNTDTGGNAGEVSCPRTQWQRAHVREPGFKPLTFRSWDDPLYHLSYCWGLCSLQTILKSWWIIMIMHYLC